MKTSLLLIVFWNLGGVFVCATQEMTPYKFTDKQLKTTKYPDYKVPVSSCFSILKMFDISLLK
jgi:hypothetical protein